MHKRVDVESVFLTCTLCPGICVSNCPVFTTLRIRASAPHVIARGGLRLLRSGETSDSLNLYLCTGCKGCESACPLSNPLPEAIRLSRLRLSEPPKPEAKPLYLGGDGRGVLVVSPRKPGDGVVRAIAGVGYSVYWLDSAPYTIAYWSGVDTNIPIEGFELVVSEDLDAPVENALNSLDFVKTIGLSIKTRFKDYILHVPCKVDGVEGLALKLIGEPRDVMKSCSGGGGGMLHYMEKYSVEMSRLASVGDPVVTLCRWSQVALERAGLRAYTILDLVAR